MQWHIPQLNLLFAWIGILCGFASGIYLGLNFHKDNWLGGYGSFKRRLYRLAHISFFGLGGINFIFYFTVQKYATAGLPTLIAAFGFMEGAISMPICCVWMANNPRIQPLFAVPVISLMTGAICTLMEIIPL